MTTDIAILHGVALVGFVCFIILSDYFSRSLSKVTEELATKLKSTKTELGKPLLSVRELILGIVNELCIIIINIIKVLAFYDLADLVVKCIKDILGTVPTTVSAFPLLITLVIVMQVLAVIVTNFFNLLSFILYFYEYAIKLAVREL